MAHLKNMEACMNAEIRPSEGIAAFMWKMEVPDPQRFTILSKYFRFLKHDELDRLTKDDILEATYPCDKLIMRTLLHYKTFY